MLNNKRKCVIHEIIKIDASHLEMTACPRHRDSFGSRWQSGRPIYTILDEIASAAHKSSSVKGLCGLRSSNHSAYVLCVYYYILAVCFPTGSLKSPSRFTNFVFPLLEWLFVLVTTKVLVRMHKIHVKKDSSEP